jgi:Ca2+/Na+ antiporter
VATTSTTSTTIAAIGNKLPQVAATLPLTTKGTNGHVNPVFALLSGIGFFLVLVIMVGRFVATRPNRTKSGAGSLS